MPPLLRAFVAFVVAGFVASPVHADPPLAPSRDIRSYVLFAYDEMILKGAVGTVDRGYIRGGDIGVNYADRGQDGSPSLSYATLGPVIMDAGSNAVADSVRAANAQGVFFNLFANSVNASFDATILGAGPLPFTTPIIPTANLPVLPFTPGRALTDGAADVQVGGIGLPSPHTMAPGAYRDVRVNDRKTLNLGDGTYDFRSLSVGTNVTVNVTDRTVIQIDRDWHVNDGLQFGVGTRSGARVYLGALGFGANQLPVVNFAHRSELHMQFFSPTGWLDMGGINQLHGRYWAQRITGDMRTAICASPAYLAKRRKPTVPKDLLQHDCINYRRISNGEIYRWELTAKRRDIALSVDGRVVTNDGDLMLRAALDGLGIAYLIESVAAPHLAAKRLVRLLTAFSPRFPGLYLYYPSGPHPAPKLRALVDFFRARRASA